MRAATLFVSALALAACAAEAQEGEDYGDGGTTTTRSFQVGSFDSVSLGGSHNVMVRVGPAASVRAEGPAEELDRLKIEVRNGDLHIGTKRDKWRVGFRGSREPVTVYVTTPSLAAASIGGSGDMKIDRVEGHEFAAAIGGSGDMDIGRMRVGEASFSIAGSGGIRAAGSARKSSISVAGSGDVSIEGVQSRTASVSVVGSGNVRARADETAEVSILGSGDVTMGGTARCSVSKMGSGNVRCGS